MAAGQGSPGNVKVPDFVFEATNDDQTSMQNSIDDFLGLNNQATSGPSGIDALLVPSAVSQERIPMLEAAFDRLVKLLRQSVRKLTSDFVEVKLQRTTSMRFSQYVEAVSLPALLGVFKAEPWNSLGMMTITASMVNALTDVVFGGSADRSPPMIDGRSFSPIELNVIRRFSEAVLADLGTAFRPIADITFALEQFETNPRFIAVTQPQNVVVLSSFKIELGTLVGFFDLVIPLVMLEPVRDSLNMSYLGGTLGQDVVWRDNLLGHVQRANVTLDALLHEEVMTLRQVMNLKVGDTISTNMSPTSLVTLRCDKVALAKGSIGRVGGKIAIQVQERIDRPQDGVPAGG